MAAFKYRAVAANGGNVTGIVRGSSVEGVSQSLTQQGLKVEQVSPHKRSILDFEITPTKIDRVELSNFSRQMAAFIGAGVPMLDALAIIETEAKDKALRKVVREVADALRVGESFPVAMAAQGNAFPPFYTAVLQSSEATGELEVVLGQLARYIERDTEARRKIRSALTYPILVMIMAAITVVVLTAVVLPQFKTFFESFDARLPLATRMLLATTDFLTNWYPLIVGTLLVLLIVIIAGLQTKGGRGMRDRFLLRVPVVGDVVRYTVIERFCRVLGSMVQAGVPMPEALTLASTGANNRVYERKLIAARVEILEGEGICGPITRTGLFPGSVTQMMRVGEETGTLEEQLEVMASYYGVELEYKLKRLTNLFEPICVIMVGAIVGFVAIALVSAIYGIYNQVDLQ